MTKRALTLFAALVVALCSAAALAADAPATNRSDPADAFDARIHRSKTVANGTLPYRLLAPAGYDPKAADEYPLLLLLHGAGERGTDNKAQLKWGGKQVATDLQAVDKCFVVAPQCPPNRQWVNTPWGKGSYSTEKVAISDELKMAIEAVESAVAEFKVDKRRVYVMGLSMGGFGTWDAIARRPDLFAAAVPICGGGDPSAAERIKAAGIAVWAFHGGADNVVPTAGTREMVEALKKAGLAEPDVKYTEFPGVGHNAWTPAWETKGLFDWLMRHKRPAPAPK